MTWSTSSSTGTTGTGEFLGLATVTGTANVKMYGKLRDNAPASDINFDDLRLSSFDKAEYVSNQNTVTSAVGSISAVNVSIDSTTLSVTRVDGLGDTNLAVGSKAVTLYGLNLAVTQGNPVSISNAEFTVTNTATTAGTAQVSTVTVTDTANADDYVVVINGTAYTVTDTAGTAYANSTDLATAIALAVDANAAVSATSALGVVTITASTAGTAFTIANTASTVPANVVVATPTLNVAPALTNQHLNNVFATLYIDGAAVKTETINAGVVKFSGITKTVTTTPTNMTIKADFSDAFANGDISFKLSSLDMVDTLTSQPVLLGTTPSSAMFTIAQAVGTLSTSDSNPKRSLLLAGAKDQKILAFRVKAENDNIKLRDLIFA